MVVTKNIPRHFERVRTTLFWREITALAETMPPGWELVGVTRQKYGVDLLARFRGGPVLITPGCSLMDAAFILSRKALSTNAVRSRLANSLGPKVTYEVSTIDPLSVIFMDELDFAPLLKAALP